MEVEKINRIEKKISVTNSKNQFRVLIIDDDPSILVLLSEFYKDRNFKPESCGSAEEALRRLLEDKKEYDLIICDLNLPQKSGLNFIEELMTFNTDTPVILITAHGSVDAAAIALKKGAFDYITKPLNFVELEVVSQRAIKINNLEKNYNRLKERLNFEQEPKQVLGTSLKMRELMILVNKVAQSMTNVLISGESGSGKEMIAQAIHGKSKRAEKKFIPINCSAIPNELLEAELFGHKKGAFTGAGENRIGLFEEANGGTLFLDEIGDMPLSLQAKVLRVIQEKKVKPIGQNEYKDLDVRIIAATNKDLKSAIRKKEFREDLYYRLCVIPIQVPPLRERREDIPILAGYFLKKYSLKNEKNITGFTRDAMSKIKRMRWSGNVRELENTVERAVVLSNENLIYEQDITVEGSIDLNEQTSLLFRELLSLKELEKQYIMHVLDKTCGKKDEASEILGINRKTLYRKEKDYGLQ